MKGSSTYVMVGLAVGLVLGSCGGGGELQDATPQSSTPRSTTDATQVRAATTTTAGATTVDERPNDVPAPDPCSLLTAADIEDATGVRFGEGAFNADLSGDMQSICDWIGTVGYATVQTLIVPIDVWAAQRESAAIVFAVVDVDIPGADAAYVTEEGSLIGMQVAGMFLQVSYIPPGPGDVLPQTTALAATAAANFRG